MQSFCVGMPSRDIRDGVCALLLSEAVRSALGVEAGRKEKESKPSPFRSFLQCGQARSGVQGSKHIAFQLCFGFESLS